MSTDTTLNKQQLAAALDTEGAVLVTAGAGSGKTRLLTHRIVRLVRECNVAPYSILAITFTNKAAEEMRNRLQNMLPDVDGVWVSTFHSMCVKILRSHIERIGYKKNFTIYDENDSERVVKRIVKQLDVEEDGFVKTCISAISEAKSKGRDPESLAEHNAGVSNIDTIVDVYEKYESELKNNNALDFDDLLNKAYDLLCCTPDVLESYRRRFRYIHVDEFQDTNIVQYNLVKLLAGSNGNVFVVGDEDQSIYGWRGADITGMQNFISDYGARIYKLEQNYRSTNAIIQAANSLIANNTSRIEKKLWTMLGEGAPINVYRAESDVAEADYVVSMINKLLRSGYRPSDFAVLMRINALTRVIEQRLMQYNIPYKVFGGFKFFDRKEVKDVLSYLKVLNNSADNESLLRVINYPKRGIGDGAIAQLSGYASVEGKRLFDVILNIANNNDLPLALIKKVAPFAELLRDLVKAQNEMNVYELAQYVVEHAGFEKLFEEETADNLSRKMNIEGLLDSIKEFSVRHSSDLTAYLEEITLYSEDDSECSDAVYLSTIHSAKGMEFRIVFIIGIEEGIFPLSRATDSPNELEEERRLMYVGITRAKERLALSFCSSRFMYGERRAQIQSRFFGEIDSRLLPKASQSRTPNYTAAQSRFNVGTATQPSPIGVVNVAAMQTNRIADFPVGTRVKHKKFGNGIVESITDIGGNSYLTIKFEVCGSITLSLQFAPIQKVE